ncbi:MAG: HAMP domain-containing histidine kinase [Oscillospiraceae bacterium]|jgi:signal transduction histidine kinase|nr:HAMP domain-containing histidine kinase [Oscillospiraceae bacterium]
MIKNLRRRILAISISMLLLIMTGVFGAVFAIMYRSEVSQSKDIIENTFSIHLNDRTSYLLFTPDLVYINPQFDTFSPLNPKQSGTRSGLKGDTVFFKVDLNHNISFTQYHFTDIDEAEKEASQKAVAEIFNSSTAKSEGVIEVGENSFRYAYKLVSDYNQQYYAVVLLNRAAEISVFKRLIGSLAKTGVILLIVLVTVCWFLSKWVVKPTENAYEKQKQFVSDAAHELKTPLTVISANIDAILLNPDDTVSEQKKWLTYIKDEALRMSNLTNNLLKLARDTPVKNVYTPFNFSSLLRDICINFEVLIFEKKKKLETDIQDDIFIKGNPDNIKQVITILLDNAIKYSTDYSVITVSLKKNKKTELIVKNTGSEIPKDELTNIFNRFFRVDSSRTKSTGGFGLGLSIAKKILDDHHANISCQSSNNTTSFLVFF